MAKKSRAITKKRRGAEQENGMAPSENVAAPAEGNSTPKVTQTMRVPRPLRPAALSWKKRWSTTPRLCQSASIARCRFQLARGFQKR